MSIKTKIFLDISEFMRKIRQMSSSIKSLREKFNQKYSFSNGLKDFIKGYSVSSLIGKAIDAVFGAARRRAEILFMWFKTKLDDLRHGYEQYDAIIARSQKKTGRDKSDLAALESFQMKKGPLTYEEKELQHQAALRLRKNNPGVQIEYDAEHRIKNFGDLQYGILEANRKKELAL